MLLFFAHRWTLGPGHYRSCGAGGGARPGRAWWRGGGRPQEKSKERQCGRKVKCLGTALRRRQISREGGHQEPYQEEEEQRQGVYNFRLGLVGHKEMIKGGESELRNFNRPKNIQLIEDPFFFL